MIKNTSPDKSGNPESLKKLSQQFESFSNNLLIVGEHLLRVCSTDCFIYSFVIQTISEKTECSKGFTTNLRSIFT